MNSERIQVQHAEEQMWRRLRDYREDITRVADDGPDPEDELLIKSVFNYIIARMIITDFDLEEA